MANSRLNSNSAFVSPITVPAKPLCKTPEINLLANAADENERNGFHNDRADGRVGVDKGKLRSAGGKNISITKAHRERRRQCRKSENDVPSERFLLRDFPFSN
ncbi:MAG: hypothetical protein U0L58_04230 [Ruminococcus sp.]|nr:hypothetical protein [Ruminococcus sp.]